MKIYCLGLGYIEIPDEEAQDPDTLNKALDKAYGISEPKQNTTKEVNNG